MTRLSHTFNIVLVVFVSLAAGCSATNASTVAAPVRSGHDILSADHLDPTQRYVIYLHGKIIEDQGPEAVHPEFGAYEYEEILASLAEPGAQVISEVRLGETNATTYAETVTGWIAHLLAEGIPPENITVIGFSKGAGITILVSILLDNSDLNYVLIGICTDEIIDNPMFKLNGRILSIYETSDGLGGSCQILADRSQGVTSFDEIPFSTGEGHGAFYQADDFWLDPVVDWIIAP